MKRSAILLVAFVGISFVCLHGQAQGPDREQWNKPDQIMDALKIGEGSLVGEIGAGGGWFSIRLARRVRANGQVWAEDIQPEPHQHSHRVGDGARVAAAEGA